MGGRILEGIPKVERTNRSLSLVADSLGKLESLLIGRNAVPPPQHTADMPEPLQTNGKRSDRISLSAFQLPCRAGQSESSAPSPPVHADSLQPLGLAPLPLFEGKLHPITRDQVPLLLPPWRRSAIFWINEGWHDLLDQPLPLRPPSGEFVEMQEPLHGTGDPLPPAVDPRQLANMEKIRLLGSQGDEDIAVSMLVFTEIVVPPAPP